MQAATNTATFPGAMSRFRDLDKTHRSVSRISTRKNKIFYWASTGFLAFGMLSQGFAQVFLTKGYVDMVNVHLGYPSYFLYIIGIWKILGVIAILIPGFKLVKEWAYAGFFFVMSGALFSHIAAHDPVIASGPALFLLSVVAISWFFRPADRKVVSINQ